MLSRLQVSLLLILPMVSVGFAQDVTVQLPTFNFQTVNTTVMVPDRGTTLLGGIKRASTGSTERGVPILSKVPFANRLFKNRGIGQEYGTTMTAVKAKILILEELEEEVLGRAATSRAARGDRRTFEEMAAQYQAESLKRKLATERLKADYMARERTANFIQQQQRFANPYLAPRKPTQRSSAPDVDEIRRRNEQARQQRAADAASYFERAQEAESAGKMGVARIYYNMVVRRATGPLKQQAEARIAGLNQ